MCNHSVHVLHTPHIHTRSCLPNTTLSHIERCCTLQLDYMYNTRSLYPPDNTKIAFVIREVVNVGGVRTERERERQERWERVKENQYITNITRLLTYKDPNGVKEVSWYYSQSIRGYENKSPAGQHGLKAWTCETCCETCTVMFVHAFSDSEEREKHKILLCTCLHFVSVLLLSEWDQWGGAEMGF